MKETDTLLMIGTSFPYMEYLPKPGQAIGIQIDVKAEKIGLRYPIQIGLVGDSKTVLLELLPLLNNKIDTNNNIITNDFKNNSHNVSLEFLQSMQKSMEKWNEIMKEQSNRYDAKAISLDARVLIMDEPTAALSGVEVERLFAVARSLRDEGRALLFISHRFDEVFDLCDIVTVMRDGAYIATTPIAETTVDELVRQMVGRDVAELFPKLPGRDRRAVLDVDGLTRAGVFHDITFTVRSGEIVGLAGLVGAGRSEVARAVFGVDPYESGSVHLEGTAAAEGQPAGRDGARPRPRPRGPPQAGARARRERRRATSRSRSGVAREGRPARGAAENARRALGQPPRGEDRGARHRDRHAERRQPAEGRARQVARHRAHGAHRRRADPRHRCRHQGRGAPTALRARHSRESPSS